MVARISEKEIPRTPYSAKKKRMYKIDIIESWEEQKNEKAIDKSDADSGDARRHGTDDGDWLWGS